MNLSRRILAPLAALCAAAALVPAPARAQLGETPQSLNAQATTAMNEGRWQQGLELLTRCVERFDRNAMTLYGPQFGVTWYRKGICELQLKQWEAAIESFKTCYEKYPNDSEEAQGGGNIFNKRALLRWGEAAQGAQQWEEAIKRFQQFLEERDPSRDNFHPGSFYINLAVCHLRAGNVAEGVKHYETALQNKERYRTPEAGIVSAFQALVDAVIQERDEEALIGFLDANRSDIVIPPSEMQAYAGLFLSLGGKAYNAEMHRIAFSLYQLVPGTRVMLQDVRSRLDRLGDREGIVDGGRVIRRSELEASESALERSLDSGDPNEVVQLGATAFIHEKKGNVRGAYAAYRQLELFYPKSEKREDNLYNLVRTASVVGEFMKTEEFGSRFLADFPDSDHVPAVRRLMLTSLFYNGQYETCIEIANEMLPQIEEGTEQHDICLHVLGGSYHYTGAYRDAQPLLDQHVETYPESKFAMAASYFQASNLSRLQFWSRSAKLLDAFLEEYPDPDENIYLPFALYDRANCHYAMEEYDAALEKINRLESGFPDAEVLEMAFNLKGNILENQNEDEQAENYYEQALALAERRENDLVAAEALNYLVAMLGEDPDRTDDAVAYADKFWEEYGDSPYKARVAVGQITPFKAAGRGEEALNRLRDVIAEMAASRADGLEEAINSYTELYLEDHTVEELKQHYYDFPGIRTSNRAARALLRIALIGVFEDQIREAGNDRQARIQAEAGIKVLFEDLADEFDLDDLSNFILVRVGDFIRQTNSPREALPYYNEALERDNRAYRFAALSGRAAVLAQGSEAEQAEAIEDFKRILDDSEDRSEKDTALFRIIETQMEMGEYEKAKENARRYLDREEGFSQRKPAVALMLGRAYDEMGQREDALATYNNIRASYPGAIRQSAQAVKRSMEIAWKRDRPATEDRPSDRQSAYNAGRTYLDSTRRIVVGENARATDEEVELWEEVEELTERYVANPRVKSKEELRAEAESR